MVIVCGNKRPSLPTVKGTSTSFFRHLPFWEICSEFCKQRMLPRMGPEISVKMLRTQRYQSLSDTRVLKQSEEDNRPLMPHQLHRLSQESAQCMLSLTRYKVILVSEKAFDEDDTCKWNFPSSFCKKTPWKPQRSFHWDSSVNKGVFINLQGSHHHSIIQIILKHRSKTHVRHTILRKCAVVWRSY